MSHALAAIPYTTFPVVEVGPFSFRSFGVFVGSGLVVGALIAERHARQRLEIDQAMFYSTAAWMLVAGFAGARATWVVTHFDEVGRPLDAFAVWRGGLQFSGGFIGAIALGVVLLRRWPISERWSVADGLVLGLSVGLAIGRLGCIAVGEHFGRPSQFPLAVTYNGGRTQEGVLGSEQLTPGLTFHHTAVYELVGLAILSAFLWALARRGVRPGTLTMVFCLVYGCGRHLSDYLRVNDERVLGLTGAQFLMFGVVAGGVWIWLLVVSVDDTTSGTPETERRMLPSWTGRGRAGLSDRSTRIPAEGRCRRSDQGGPAR